MEDIRLFKEIEINSQIHPYKVFFENQTKLNLKNVLSGGDIIVVDKKIHEMYSPIFKGIKNSCILIIANEKAKSYIEIESIILKIVNAGFRKNNKLIAIGGGITQDITSFIASIIYRGVDWIFFPTNLLSQCDSCIGSKLSINLKTFKNLLGGFYPPKKIFISTEFLKTLSEKDKLSGLGEMLHYFIVSSKKDMEYFSKKIRNAKKDLSGIEDLICRSLTIKKKMIEIDEFDKGPRNVFNYGHTFGHALESVTNYQIPHGISVSFGIDLANFISVKLGFMDVADRNKIRHLCSEVFFNTSLPVINFSNYKDALMKDKKNIGNKLGLILSKGAGSMFKHFIEYKQIESYIHEFFIKKIYLNDI